VRGVAALHAATGAAGHVLLTAWCMSAQARGRQQRTMLTKLKASLTWPLARQPGAARAVRQGSLQKRNV